eukprot:4722771-Amphidinium_carterae.1
MTANGVEAASVRYNSKLVNRQQNAEPQSSCQQIQDVLQTTKGDGRLLCDVWSSKSQPSTMELVAVVVARGPSHSC